MSSLPVIVNSFLYLEETSSSLNLPFVPSSEFACAIVKSLSSIADKYSISAVTFPPFTFLYGVSRNPYLFVLANKASELINPIFGPSGVSIGHTLP